MRLLLIALQAGIAATVYALVMGAVASPMPAPGAGGNILFVALQAVAVALQALVVGLAFLPVIAGLLLFAALFMMSIACAVLCGYRIFRWTRWIGILLNLGLACLCVFFLNPGKTAGDGWIIFKAGSVGFFLFCCYLFFAVPKRPDVEKIRRVVAKTHVLLVAVFAVFLLANVPSRLFASLCFALAIYSVPFLVNARFTRSAALQAPWKRIVIPVVVSLLFMLISGLFFPPLAVPVAVSLFLFIGLLEALFLFPANPLPEKNWRYYAVKLLGRLPDTQNAASVF